MCEHTWLVTNCSNVCSSCGLERGVLKLDTWNKYAAPLTRNYDRKSRFSVKVDKLLGIHTGPHYSDKIWKVLETQSLRTPNSIRKAIRHSGLNTKHYDCLRIFCDVFTKFQVTGYCPHRIKRYLEKCFADVHRCWLRTHWLQNSFFSYDFLLRYFLEEIQSPLLVYLKPKTNKRRLRKYVQKLKLIQFPGVCKTYYQNSAGDHFRSVSDHACSPPYLQL